VTINQAAGQSDPTNASPINFTVVFTEPVTGFATGDVTLSGTAGATTGTVTEIAPNDGTTYNVAVSGMTSDGTVTASIAINKAQDAAGNNNTASTSTDNTVVYDATQPDVTINQASGQADPASAIPINFTVIFTEPVTGFATGDVTLGGTAGATTGTVTEIAPNDGTTYNVAVSGMTGDGTVIASLPAGAATDGANLSAASTSADNSVLYDATSPDVTINQAVGQSDSANASPINFTVVFTEPVTGFATGDVTLSGTAGATTGTVAEIAPNDGTTFNLAVSGMTGDGSVIVSIAAGMAQDGVGNLSTASTSADNTVVYDATPPDVTINQAAGQSDPTNASPINFTVVFTEPVTGFATGDVTLSGTAGATTGTVTEIAPMDGTTYNVAVSGMTSDGTVTASVAINKAQDAAGNNNTASTSSDNTVTYIPDSTPPNTTIDSHPANPTNSVNAAFTFSGTDNFTPPGSLTFECQLDGGGFTACASAQNYNALSDGSHTFQVRAIDAVGNGDPTPDSFTWTVDTTAPTVVMSSGASDPTNTSPIPVTVTFSESVADFIAADIVPVNGGVGNFAGSGASYTFDLTPSGQGLVTANIAASVATDSAGNANTAATQFSRTYDTTAPTVTNVTSTSADGSYTTGAVIPITVTFSEAVTVTGTPQLTLETGATDRVVNYISGSGTNTLTFNYTVQAGDSSADLDYVSTTALALNGGTITDAALNAATLTLAAPGAAGSLGANKALVIGATVPSLWKYYFPYVRFE
jgi:hypothetical protein